MRKIIDIELPRPRELDVLSSTEAYEYKREAMELLHEEALRNEGWELPRFNKLPGPVEVITEWINLWGVYVNE